MPLPASTSSETPPARPPPSGDSPPDAPVKKNGAFKPKGKLQPKSLVHSFARLEDKPL